MVNSLEILSATYTSNYSTSKLLFHLFLLSPPPFLQPHLCLRSRVLQGHLFARAKCCTHLAICQRQHTTGLCKILTLNTTLEATGNNLEINQASGKLPFNPSEHQFHGWTMMDLYCAKHLLVLTRLHRSILAH